jgi:hypothetical protein
MIHLDEVTAELFATINRTRDAYLDLDFVESTDSTLNVVIKMELQRSAGPIKSYFCVYDSPLVEYTIALQNVIEKIHDVDGEKTLLLAEIDLKSESIRFSGTNGSLEFRFRAGDGKINCVRESPKGSIRHVASPFFDFSFPISKQTRLVN